MDYIYKGWSTKRYLEDKNFVLTDLELVKEDLINHIFTRKGERVRMANFGTTIPDLIFESLVPDTVEQVKEQLTLVFNYDPRVRLVDMVVLTLAEEKAIVALADLEYIELKAQDRLSLRIEFDA